MMTKDEKPLFLRSFYAGCGFATGLFAWTFLVWLELVPGLGDFVEARSGIFAAVLGFLAAVVALWAVRENIEYHDRQKHQQQRDAWILYTHIATDFIGRIEKVREWAKGFDKTQLVPIENYFEKHGVNPAKLDILYDAGFLTTLTPHHAIRVIRFRDGVKKALDDLGKSPHYRKHMLEYNYRDIIKAYEQQD